MPSVQDYIDALEAAKVSFQQSQYGKDVRRDIVNQCDAIIGIATELESEWGSSQANPDTTLTQVGVPAEAKATGDAIAAVDANRGIVDKLVVGTRCAAGYNNSVAAGMDTETGNIDNSFAFGYNLQSSGQFVIGDYNASPTGAKFMVGNGTNGNRSNAFVVYNNGDAEAKNVIKSSKLDVSVGAAAVNTIGTNSAAIGSGNTVSGANALGVGNGVTASNDDAVAIGRQTEATGANAFAQGNLTIASGAASVAEGTSTTASGAYSHAEGQETIAAGTAQHVSGRKNIADNSNIYAAIVGNGSALQRSNAYTLDWTGLAWFANAVCVGGTSDADPNAKYLATEDYVDTAISTAIGAAISASY